LPYPATKLRHQLCGRAVQTDTTARQENYPGTDGRNLLHQVSGEEHDGPISRFSQDIEKPVALGWVEAGARLVQQQKSGVADQRLRDPEASSHSAGQRCEHAVANVP
jgi:hypothetical protein